MKADHGIFEGVGVEQRGALAPRLRVAVVVVNYCGLTDVHRCITTLEPVLPADAHIVLIDNASPDGSGLQLRSAFAKLPQVTCILNPENRGFAAACNLGIRHANSLGADYVWLLNPDVEVKDANSLSALCAALDAHSDLAAVGSKVLYGDGRRIWSAGGVVERKTRQMYMRGCGEFDQGQYEEVFECGYIPGCSLLVRTSVLKQIGMLPEEYFMYFEETDWCLRARAAGYRLLFEPKSVVLHHFEEEKMQSPRTVYYYNRNERLFWLRFGSFRQRLGILGRTLFQELPRSWNAYSHCSDPELRPVFRAHFRSALDALRKRDGKRF